MLMQLKKVHVDSIYFEKNKDFNPEDEHIGIEYNIFIKNRFDDSKCVLTVELGVKTDPIDDSYQAPFAFDVTMHGDFLFKEVPDEKTLKQFGDINCPAIVFPYIREVIADITRRSGFSPLHLPAVNFIEMGKKNKRGEG